MELLSTVKHKYPHIEFIVMTGYGINCEMEMAHACRLAGSEVVDIVHINELIHGEKRLDDYHFLNLPGGFLDGDDLGSAKAGANRIRYAKVSGDSERLFDQFLRFIEKGKLILGACNGFQLLAKLGLIPNLKGGDGEQEAEAGRQPNESTQQPAEAIVPAGPSPERDERPQADKHPDRAEQPRLCRG